MKKWIALLMALIMTLALVSCGGDTGSTPTGADPTVVNIGCTSSVGTLNPILVDGTWSNYYAMSLQYLPLVALDANAEFEYMLADSITTEDNLHYTIHINESAQWSDGTPITAADVAFTIDRLASPVIANPAMMLHALVGTDDDTGYLPEGVDSVSGVQVIDEKTLEITFKYELSKISFLNGYAQYILTVPKHVLETVPVEELTAYSWFTSPDVVSGPYQATGFDSDHYVTYTANENYWRGEVGISHANIKIVDSAALYAGLQSGEIDIVPPLLGVIASEDYAGVQALSNVTAEYGAAYAVENVFINTQIIDNENIRKALLLAIDRQQIIDGLLGGAGDLADGFAVPDGPYWSDLTPLDTDMDAAKALVQTAISEGWDSATTYTLYANAGESQLALALQLAQQAWSEAGIQVKLQSVDLDTLMGMVGGSEAAMIAVQYTYPPAELYWDIKSVLGSWCYALTPEVESALDTLLSTNDTAAYAQALLSIDSYVQQTVPMIDLYISAPLGAVSHRLQNATASMYGALNNIHQWNLAE